MRYFFLIFVLMILAVVGAAGFRGRMSRKPPIEVFPDMDRQPKLRPQEPNAFFSDGRSSRLPVSGTIARSQPIEVTEGSVAKAVYSYEDSPVNTGRLAGTTNFVEVSPVALTQQLLLRGRERFQIYCAPCHSKLADGNGVPKRIGAMAAVANLQDPRIVKMTDGEIFTIITGGRNLMGAYGPQVPATDRWAIIAYLRTLQLSRLGTVDDVPVAERASLKK